MCMWDIAAAHVWEHRVSNPREVWRLAHVIAVTPSPYQNIVCQVPHQNTNKQSKEKHGRAGTTQWTKWSTCCHISSIWVVKLELSHVFRMLVGTGGRIPSANVTGVWFGRERRLSQFQLTPAVLGRMIILHAQREGRHPPWTCFLCSAAFDQRFLHGFRHKAKFAHQMQMGSVLKDTKRTHSH